MSAPNLTIQVQPAVGSTLVYAPLAAKTSKDRSNGQLLLLLTITNNEPLPITLRTVTVSFVGPPNIGPYKIDADVTIPSMSSGEWRLLETWNPNILLPIPAPQAIKLSLLCDNFGDPVNVAMSLAPYVSPVTGGGYAFPFKTEDLNSGEFWTGYSGGDDHRARAYDLKVYACDRSTKSWQAFETGADVSKNESWYIWDKPIYAIADGVVKQSCHTMPNNKRGELPSSPQFREGNHLYLQHGVDLVLYAHFKAGTLDTSLQPGASVFKGQLLGHVGNSGHSWEPHLHIEVFRTTALPPPGGTLRPLPFSNIYVLDMTAVSTAAWPPNDDSPWNAVSGQCLPSELSAIWPGNLLHGRRGWLNLSKPQRANVIGLVGAVTVMDTPNSPQRPHVFVAGNDGNLWCLWDPRSGGAWNWTNMGKPQGANIRGLMGAVTVMDTPISPQRPHVFVEGNDFNLWCLWYPGSGSVWNWSNMGKPQRANIIGLVGAVTVMDSPTSPQRPHVFVAGNDGNLWCLWDPRSGGAWNWTNMGEPQVANIRGLMGAVTVMDTPISPQRPHVFVEGNDFNLWCLWYPGSGSVWNWSNMGKPQSANIRALMGVVAVKDTPTSPQRPHLFVEGNDSNLWCLWDSRSGGAWNWTNMGKPPAANIVGLVGAVTAMDTPTSPQRPRVFVAGNDGNLWCLWWSGRAWSWLNRDIPQRANIRGLMGALTVMDTPISPQRPHVFVEGNDYNLWCLWSSWTL